jgi:hypothetical protein
MGWASSGQRLVELSECVGQLQVRRIVDRAGDHRDGVVGEGLAQRRQQLVGRVDAVSAGAEPLGVGDEVGVGER